MIAFQQIDLILKVFFKLLKNLQQTKLTSISDIIKFIIQHVSKTLNFGPLQQLQLRIQQLQRPKGLDRIMIQQVKTLVEAIVDQRENQIYTQIDHQMIETLQKFQQKIFDKIKNDLDITNNNNNRQNKQKKVLTEIDMLQMFNTVNQINQLGKNNTQQQSQIHHHNNNTYSQQSYQRSKRLNSNYSHNYGFDQQRKIIINIDSIMKEINQIRFQLEKKVQKKDLTQYKTYIAKQMTKKVTVNQTQIIVNRFQQEIFSKLNNNVAELQRVEYNLKKNINDQLLVLKKDFSDALKIKQTKNNLLKLQKKVKKHIDLSKQNAQQIQNKIYQISRQIKGQKQDMYQQIGQICQLVQGISNVTKKTVIGKWIATGNFKSQQIVWQQQNQNNDKQAFLFEPKKTPIMITKPGYYQFNSIIFGCRKTPSIFLNSQQIAKFQCNKNANEVIPTFSFRQVLRINNIRSTITIKIQGDGDYQYAIMSLKKL